MHPSTVLPALAVCFALVSACSGDTSAAGTGPDRPGSDGGGRADAESDAPEELTDAGPGDAARDDANPPADADDDVDVDGPCIDGTRTCDGASVVACQPDGTYAFVEACPTGCERGQCVDPCGGDEKSYYGCTFWAVDLDNSDQEVFGSSADGQQFAVTVSNPGDVEAEVLVFDGDDVLVAGPVVVPPLGLQSIPLPRADANDTQLARIGYRISANAPVSAHQFNPQQNSNVYSNDASLLLPARALGTTYVVAAWPTEVQNVPLFGPRPLRSFVTVVAVADGRTRVTVTPNRTTGTAAGPGVDAIAAGASQEFVLQQGDVLSLTTPDVHAADFTGMRIDGDRAIAVFSGSECGNVPLGNTYCDHLEEQLSPVDAWGTRYLATKFAARGTEPDVWRVVASEPGTVVTTSPPQPGAADVTIGPGDVLEFESTDDFVIDASRPVSVAQFMVGSSYPGPANGCTRDENSTLPQTCAIPSSASCTSGSGIGDPAQLMTVPETQLRTDYVVLTPVDYAVDWLTIAAPSSATVELDGAALGPGDAVPGVDWSVWRLEVADGVHRVTSTLPAALYAYGYDCDVSYAYAGGTNLETAAR